MEYHLCPDVSLEEICGTHLLIASGEALAYLDYVRVINEVGYKVLKRLQAGMKTEEIVQVISQEYDMETENIRPGILGFLKELKEKGYLILDEGGQR